MAKQAKTNKLGSLSEKESGQLILSGEIDYRNGKQLREIGRTIINNSSAKEFTLSCATVTRTSSVGLSLVLSLIRDAQRLGKSFVIISLPIGLEEIAKFSGVIDILPLSNELKIIDNVTG